MEAVRHLGVTEVARFEGIPPKTLLRRLERKRIILAIDPEDTRRKLIPVSVLSPAAYQAWVRAETCAALQDVKGQPQETLSGEENYKQSSLPFAAPSQSESTLLKAVPPAVPERNRTYVERWALIIGDCTNGTWQKYRGQCLEGITIQSRQDFICAQAKIHGVGISTVHQKLKLLKEVNHNPDIPANQKMAEFWRHILPKNRAGRSGHSFFSDDENAWMREKLLSLYLTQAKHSLKDAHRLLLAGIDAKQRAWGAEHIYQRPTLRQCRTVLKGVDSPTFVLAREGNKAFYNQCAPYISRKPPEFSDFIWCTDQKVADVRVQDAGHRLGRLTSVSFIDVTSNKWLGCCFAPVLSSDVVMRAAVDAMIRTGTKPRYVQFDLGKEFYNHRFGGGVSRIKGETLFREALGMWQRLGVEPVKAIGNNPRTKPIERWHAEHRKLDQGFITYTGKRPDDRPERLAKIEAQHYAWLAGEAENPRIPTIEEYIDEFLKWCVLTWNLETRGYGKYLLGMTPEQCWNAKRPPEGFPRVTEDEINFQTCERRKEQVATGGQINLQVHGQKLEYVADELFALQGQPVKVLLSRISYRTVTVIYPVTGGAASCVAQVKEQYDWVPEGDDAQERMRAAIRAQRRVKRAVRTGIDASTIVSDSANPMEVLQAVESLPSKNPLASRGLFGNAAPQPPVPSPDHPSIGSVEWMATRRSKTASAAAERFMQEEH
jgi:hypothetical protein